MEISAPATQHSALHLSISLTCWTLGLYSPKVKAQNNSRWLAVVQQCNQALGLWSTMNGHGTIPNMWYSWKAARAAINGVISRFAIQQFARVEHNRFWETSVVFLGVFDLCMTSFWQAAFWALAYQGCSLSTISSVGSRSHVRLTSPKASMGSHLYRRL